MEFGKTAPKDKLIPNPKARLREQVREVMRFHHYSQRTEEAYWQWIKRFIFFHGKRHPRELGQVAVSAFLSDLTMAHQRVGPIILALIGVWIPTEPACI